MKNKPDKKRRTQDSEMNGFCVKQGQGLKASAAHPHPNYPLRAPPGGDRRKVLNGGNTVSSGGWGGKVSVVQA